MKEEIAPGYYVITLAGAQRTPYITEQVETAIRSGREAIARIVNSSPSVNSESPTGSRATNRATGRSGD